jgi:hypothetical protein
MIQMAMLGYGAETRESHDGGGNIQAPNGDGPLHGFNQGLLLLRFHAV